MESLVPVHIGLVGHIDHGKTALAQVLSEKVSTAGLDGHPQSKRRGITIDLGFTMFTLDDKLVTLVDAPGHADLIRSVVAGASIIDAAILVVAADEGPMVQTGEHMVVLKVMGIDQVVVAITKVDLASEERIVTVKEKIQSIASDIGLQCKAIINVSAQERKGIDALRDVLRTIEPRQRITQGQFLLPIDHAFPIRGHGTVVTGTVLTGTVNTGETVHIAPLGSKTRIRSIQTFGEERDHAKAGDRVGINLPDIDHESLHRGYYLTTDPELQTTTKAIANLSQTKFYKGRITKHMIVNATVGMPTVTSEVIPFESRNGDRVILPVVNNDTFDCALMFKRPLAIYPGMQVLLMRSDLPPTMMRILASGRVTQVVKKVRLKRVKRRTGRVQRIRDNDILVEGLASSKSVADQIIGSQVYAETGVMGKIKATFGTRGVVIAVFEESIEQGTVVTYERFVEEEFEFGH